MIERVDFVQDGHRLGANWAAVVEVADTLVSHLSNGEIQTALAEANQPGSSSAAVQAVLLTEAVRLGFRDESKGLFSGYPSSALRPDYYMPVGDSGILMEVERGKTTINNMDLLDFWKCHICEHASFLFLLVPRELRQNVTMSPRRGFATEARGMESFFRPAPHTNVHGLLLVGC